MDKMKINLYELLGCLSGAVDLVSSAVSGHHHKTASLAFRIAQQMELSAEAQRNVYMAGIIHDIGALSLKERLELLEGEPVTANSHGFRGARLLEEFGPLSPVADIVRFHHARWEYGRGRRCIGCNVGIESHIVHLADRAVVMIKDDVNVLEQIPQIIESINERKGSVFAPEIVDALMALSSKEYVWLELEHRLSPDPVLFMPETYMLEIDEVLSISRLLSRIIDFSSHFTATHSAGVAKTAEKLAELAGFSKNESLMMLVAGYLHDLGKLAISDAILEKPGKLNESEFNAIRSHTFFTYQLLSRIKGFETINRWASFHHERLDGKGYPFHLMGDSIPVGSRIMAVADIFTAITEPRPYRDGMGRDQRIKLLRSMADSGAICSRSVATVLDNFRLMTTICRESQLEAAEYYDRFFQDTETQNKRLLLG
jgi:HD-GYP domain-containing protein (c-di-GMP phosphodiesterase class II)